MACSLKPDPTLAFDFIAPTGSSSTLFVENDAATAVIVDANFNGSDITPTGDGKVTITEKPGVNILDITITGAKNGDEVRLKEDCGAGVTKVQKAFTFDGDPEKRYQINAS